MQTALMRSAPSVLSCVDELPSTPTSPQSRRSVVVCRLRLSVGMRASLSVSVSACESARARVRVCARTSVRSCASACACVESTHASASGPTCLEHTVVRHASAKYSEYSPAAQSHPTARHRLCVTMRRRTGRCCVACSTLHAARFSLVARFCFVASLHAACMRRLQLIERERRLVAVGGRRPRRLCC